MANGKFMVGMDELACLLILTDDFVLLAQVDGLNLVQ
jgi:hypothetical protein